MPGLRGGSGQGSVHRVRIGVRAAVVIMVQVVELPHRRHAGRAPSRRTPPGPARSSAPDPAGPRPRTSAPARSRTCRRRRGYGRAAPGGRRGCGRWRNRAGRRRRAARHPARPEPIDDGAEPPVDRPRTGPPPATPSGNQAHSAQYAGHGGRPPARPAPPSSASTPARQSSRSAMLGRRVRDPRRVADEDHRARDPGRGEDPGVVAGPGPEQRGSGSTLRSRSVSASDRSGSSRSRTPRSPSPRTSAAAALTSATVRRTAVLVGPARVQPADSGGRNRVHSAGHEPGLADGRHAAVRGRRPTGPPGPSWRARSSRRGDPPAGSCRRGWPRRGSPVASGRAARCRCRSPPAAAGRRGRGPARRAARRRRPTRRSVSGSGPTSLRIAAGRPHGLRHAHPVGVGQPERPLGSHGPGDHPRPGAGHPEPGALLVAEVDDPDRSGRRETRRPAAGPPRRRR